MVVDEEPVADIEAAAINWHWLAGEALDDGQGSVFRGTDAGHNCSSSW